MKTTSDSHIHPTTAQTADKTKPSFVQRHLGHLGHLGLTMPGVLTLLAILSAGTANAQNFTWDPTSGDGQITDGTGNWNTTDSNWTTDAGATNVVAPSSAFGSDLLFGGGTTGTAGTITLTETGNSFGSLSFNSPNASSYDLDLNGNIVEVRRSSNTFKVRADATISDSSGGGELRHDNAQYRDYSTGSTLSISAVVADRGTAIVRTYDTITLDLSGVNTYTGNTEIYNSSTLRISGAGQLGSGTYAGNITMNNNADFNYASSANQTLSGVISDDGTGTGSNDVNVSGSGTLTLTGTNTYTGRTNISTTLEIQNSEALGTGLVVLTGGGELQFGADALDLSETVLVQNSGGNRTIRLDLAGINTGTLSGQLDIRRNGAQQFDIDVGADDTLSVTSVIIGAGSAGLTKEGAGTLIIEANSEYTGATTVNGGTLEILATAGSNAPGTDSYQINNGSTLFLNETTASNLVLAVGRGDITFGSSVTGGTLQLNGNTIFRNQTITTTGGAKNFVSAGNFNLQNSRSIAFDTAVGTDSIDLEVSASISGGDIIKNGAGTVSLRNSGNNLGTQNGGGAGEINTVTINAGTLEIGGSGRLVNGNYAGAISNDGIFKYNSTNAQELSGVISGNGAVVKDNSSTLTLSGDNTYSGNTTVSAGTLALSHASLNNIIGNSTIINVANSATLDVSALGGGTGGLELAAGQTISGSGTVVGDMTIGSGSVLSPGNSPGTMTVDNLTWTDGGTYLWEINDSTGGQGVDSGWDFISITDTFDLSGITTNFDIDITSLTLGNAPGLADGFTGLAFDGYPDVDFSFTIATANDIVGFDASKFTLNSSAFQNGGYWEIREDTNSLVLDFYAVPEPSSTALLGLGGLALALRRRRA